MRPVFHPATAQTRYASHPHFAHPVVSYGADDDKDKAKDEFVLDPTTVGLDLLAYSAFGVVTGLVFAKFLDANRGRAVKVGVGVGLGKMVWDYGIEALKQTATPTLKL